MCFITLVHLRGTTVMMMALGGMPEHVLMLAYDRLWAQPHML